MQKLKITHPDSANRIEKGIVLGWAVLVVIVILVAAALARFIVGDISAQEFVTEEFARNAGASGVNDDQFTFTDAWVRATPPGAITAAAYVDIRNLGNDDVLLAARSDKARHVEIHTTQEQSGMMRMSRLDTLPVPADSVVQLASGGHHLMFIDIPATFVPGESVIVTLVFEKAGARDVLFTVRDAR
ncbi:MAG: copper chaperone PCu(A)C [Pseudohongiella sp.]|nr:copper chaperone PCu(A)C [Pseudohongiella sp.]